MRVAKTITVAAAAATVALVAISGLAQDASAQERRRPMLLEVKPRSFLDGGRTAAVGSSSSYIYDQGSFRPGTGPTFAFTHDRPLPDRYNGGRPLTVDFQAPAFLAK
jgi:hypothetical protein